MYRPLHAFPEYHENFSQFVSRGEGSSGYEKERPTILMILVDGAVLFAFLVILVSKETLQ